MHYFQTTQAASLLLMQQYPLSTLEGSVWTQNITAVRLKMADADFDFPLQYRDLSDGITIWRSDSPVDSEPEEPKRLLKPLCQPTEVTNKEEGQHEIKLYNLPSCLLSSSPSSAHSSIHRRCI